MEISAASCLTGLLSNAQLYVCLTVHFFSFKLSSMGVSRRWGGVHPKDETQFLASADTPMKQLRVLCVHAESGASGRKERGKKKNYSDAVGARGWKHCQHVSEPCLCTQVNDPKYSCQLRSFCRDISRVM